MQEHAQPDGRQTITDDQVAELRRLAQGLKYGTLTLVFQDGALIQLERNEKIRLTRKSNRC